MLENVVQLLTVQCRMGKADFGQLNQAQRDALQAAAELADTPQERLAALRKIVEAAKANEQFIDARCKAGLAKSQLDVWQAKVTRINTQVALLREELKAE